MKKILLLIWLLILPTTSFSAGEGNKAFDAVIGLYQKIENSISQYINNNISGVLIDDLTQSNIKSVLSKLSNKREKLMSMASSALKWVSLFTYSRYVFRIEKEIINE